jgi:YHS domain-containing protein
MLGLMRLLIFALVAVAIFLAVRTLLRALASGGARRERERLGGEMAQDPICGTYVPKAGAVRRDRGGETRYFCSAACADADAPTSPNH